MPRPSNLVLTTLASMPHLQVLRVLRVGGVAVLDLMGQMAPICSPGRTPGEKPHCVRSHIPIINPSNASEWARSAAELEWLERRLASGKPLPIEVAVGAIEIKGARGCAPSQCTPHRPSCEEEQREAEQQMLTDAGHHAQHARRSAEERGGSGDEASCVASVTYGTRHNTVLLVHKFKRAEAPGLEGASCLAAARRLRFLNNLTTQLKLDGRPDESFELLPEPPVASEALARAMRRRVATLESNEVTGFTEEKTSSERQALQMRLHAEILVHGVRLWYREGKACHLHNVSGAAETRPRGGSDGHRACVASSPAAPKIRWSHLHILSPRVKR